MGNGNANTNGGLTPGRKMKLDSPNPSSASATASAAASSYTSTQSQYYNQNYSNNYNDNAQPMSPMHPVRPVTKYDKEPGHGHGHGHGHVANAYAYDNDNTATIPSTHNIHHDADSTKPSVLKSIFSPVLNFLNHSNAKDHNEDNINIDIHAHAHANAVHVEAAAQDQDHSTSGNANGNSSSFKTVLVKDTNHKDAQTSGTAFRNETIRVVFNHNIHQVRN